MTRRRHSELSEEQRRKANTRSYSNVLQRRGVLVRQPCEGCGSDDAQKHHDDYADPRNVRWLCRRCHMQEHGGNLIRPPQEMVDELRVRFRAANLDPRPVAKAVGVSVETLARLQAGMLVTAAIVERVSTKLGGAS